MQVKFNSWDEECKRPFGAIKVKEQCGFRITLSDPAKNVTLWLTKDRETPVPYEMQSDNQLNYQNRIVIDSPGLYWYYFEIKTETQSFLVGKDNLGASKIISDFNELKQYQLTCYAQDVPEVDWYSKGLVYQIFPDSFSNGNPHRIVYGEKRNSFIYATHEDTPYYIRDKNGNIVRWSFYGGNLAGITSEISYLKKLGVTAVYLNPIFSATSNHRYDTNDFFKIDSMLGTESDFIKMVKELHKNGIHLILDGVFNHVGVHSKYFQAAIKNSHSHYVNWFKFQKYPTEYSSWWGIKDLPEINKDNQEYQAMILGDHGVLKKWLDLGADGWRIDVADELPMSFIENIRKRLNKENSQVLIGEVWEDASKKFVNNVRRPYTSGQNLTGVMNYPARLFILNLLNENDLKKEKAAINTFLELVENYPTSFLHNCLNNIGTHDTKRIKTLLNDNENLVALAFGILFMLPGVPCIYYGDEAGLIGGKDPDNRRFFPWKKESKFLQKRVQVLSKIRQTNSAILNGKLGIINFESGIYSLVRYNNNKIAVYTFNKLTTAQKVSLDNVEKYHITNKIWKIISENWEPATIEAESDNFQFFKIK